MNLNRNLQYWMSYLKVLSTWLAEVPAVTPDFIFERKRSELRLRPDR